MPPTTPVSVSNPTCVNTRLERPRIARLAPLEARETLSKLSVASVVCCFCCFCRSNTPSSRSNHQTGRNHDSLLFVFSSSNDIHELRFSYKNHHRSARVVATAEYYLLVVFLARDDPDDTPEDAGDCASSLSSSRLLDSRALADACPHRKDSRRRKRKRSRRRRPVFRALPPQSVSVRGVASRVKLFFVFFFLKKKCALSLTVCACC